ncbi:MAG: glycosyltransferase family 4 protein [Oscillospiraceae bacterium]|nr:glycosyltransferase family 4 protein [Oscillospiraceae bacterium]
MGNKHLILIGNRVPKDWDFQKGVEAATGQPWDVAVHVINEVTGVKKYTRFFTYFAGPFALFLKRRQYDKIVSWEQFLALVFAFYERLFHVKTHPELTVMGFIYKPKRGLVGRVFAWFVRSTVSSEYVNRLVVYGASEIPYYSSLFNTPEEKFTAEILGQADRRDLLAQPRNPKAGKYYLAAGRSNRDYAFLRAAWPKTREPLTVVCDVEKAEDASNIHYEKNCHGDAYLRLLAGAYVSIVPLVSEKFSSGQLVFLHSAMLGKPVIVTRNDAAYDYVDHGVTGFVIDKTPEALEEALRRLDDPAVYARMSANARRAFEERFSLYELGRRIGRLADSYDPQRPL